MTTIGITTSMSDVQARDLGPITWVLPQIQESLELVFKALQRFLRAQTIGLSQGQGAWDDYGSLTQAGDALHQVTGALKMVEQKPCAIFAESMESLVRKCMSDHNFCSAGVILVLEKADFALSEYLSCLASGNFVSALIIFPQYKAVQDLLEVNRVHPADLFESPRPVNVLSLAASQAGVELNAETCKTLDQAILGMIRTGVLASDLGERVSQMAMGIAAGQKNHKASIFWTLVSAFFDVISHDRVKIDVYVKRTAATIAQHYTNAAKGEWEASESMLQELVFYCAQAGGLKADDGRGVVDDIRLQLGLAGVRSIDLSVSKLGLYNPTLKVQARKTMASFVETWSALCGGDRTRLKALSRQFENLHTLLIQISPLQGCLLDRLKVIVQSCVDVQREPEASLALEVATAILYLESVVDSVNVDDEEDESRRKAAVLIERLDQVAHTKQAIPVDEWMKELYRHHGDKQIMGNVVDELKSLLGEVDGKLDAYYRHALDVVMLGELGPKCEAMKGIYSVLGLDQAVYAIGAIKTSIEKLRGCEESDEKITKSLVQNVSAMRFLMDMLSYQRAFAKKLFVFDESRQELAFLGFRRDADAPVLTDLKSELQSDVAIEGESCDVLDTVSEWSTDVSDVLSTENNMLAMEANFGKAQNSSDQTMTMVLAEPASAIGIKTDDKNGDLDVDEMLGIFIEEAKEVLENGMSALTATSLDANTEDIKIVVRRAFHTLKGSAKMVDLYEFAEAAWSFEQLYNQLLNDKTPISTTICEISIDAIGLMQKWISAIEQDGFVLSGFEASGFRASADAMRLEGRVLPMVLRVEDVGTVKGGSSGQDEVNYKVEDEAMTRNQFFEGGDGLFFDPFSPEGTLVKQIGNLAVPIKLHTVFLEEVEIFSTELLQKAQYWTQSRDADALVEMMELAHAIVGCSGTVGFSSLAELAKCVESILEKEIANPYLESQVSLLADAAEEIRSLLHQFSAGFLKSPRPELMAGLEVLLQGSQASDGPSEEIDEPLEMQCDLPNQAAGVQVIDMFVDSLMQAQDSLKELDAFGDFKSEQLGDGSDFVQASPVSADLDAAQVSPASTSEEVVMPPLAETNVATLDAIQLDALMDIDVADEIDLDLWSVFEEEADELFLILGNVFRTWTASPKREESRLQILRNLHTLKGGARLAGAMRLGEMVHRLESYVAKLNAETYSGKQLESFMQAYDLLYGTWSDQKALRQKLAKITLDEGGPSVESDTGEAATEMAFANAGGPLLIEVEKGAEVISQTVRVNAALLDQVLNMTGEVMASRTRLNSRLQQIRSSLGDLTKNLEKLRLQVRDVEVQAETQMQSRLAQNRDKENDFDPLELDRFTRMQELTRFLAESVSDVATIQRTIGRAIDGTEDDVSAQDRQIKNMQRNLLRTRMLEFDSVCDRLYRVVRQSSKECGKQAKLDINSQSLEIDRTILERLVPLFEHLLRNAVAHGIESASERRKNNKSESGHILLEAQQDGTDVCITISDDGAGLNLKKIHESAIKRGLLPADSPQPSFQQAVKFIFMSGFSTTDVVTQQAGRGIGMDVVRAEIISLGGGFDVIEQKHGEGCTIKIVVPLTTAVMQITSLRVGDQSIAAASSMMEVVTHASQSELAMAYETGFYQYKGDQIPFFWAGALLKTQPLGRLAVGDLPQSVVLFKSAGQRIAFHVDEILGNSEVVLKPLGIQLARVPGLTGASVLTSGAIIFIYNPLALAQIYGVDAKTVQFNAYCARSSVAVASEQQVEIEPLVLVVDDSITVRRVTQRLLLRDGFRVALAGDGVQALEILKTERPSVILSDIEMPGMDGFDLVQRLRGDPIFSKTPIIMISSRTAQKHKDHAKELGATNYLGKPYDEAELIGLVKQYAGQKLSLKD